MKNPYQNQRHYNSQSSSTYSFRPLLLAFETCCISSEQKSSAETTESTETEKITTESATIGKEITIFLGSTLKATLHTHYSQNPSVLFDGIESFILENGMTHLLFRANTSHASTSGTLKRQCTLQITPRVMPSYHKMQWAIDSCSHTSNSVLACQPTCHPDMSLLLYLSLSITSAVYEQAIESSTEISSCHFQVKSCPSSRKLSASSFVKRRRRQV
jgi:hypothetical protein